jgi:transcriptional regulator with XRE-family HTH domain
MTEIRSVQRGIMNRAHLQVNACVTLRLLLWNVGRKTVQQPEWNVGRQGLFIKINVLRQLSFCNKVMLRGPDGGMAGLINEELSQEIEMLIGLHFKKKREAKGLSQKDVAQMIRSDFQESLLWDFESGDDNDIDGWLLGDFKKYCAALEIEPEEFANVPVSDLANLPLPDLVRVRREQKELAEHIGYYAVVIEALESGRADSEVCIDVLRSIGTELDIPFRLLLEKI